MKKKLSKQAPLHSGEFRIEVQAPVLHHALFDSIENLVYAYQ